MTLNTFQPKNEVMPYPLGEMRSPKDRFSDQEAFNLIRHRVIDGDTGRDSIHLRLQREWFRNIMFYLGIQNARGLQGLHTDIDTSSLGVEENSFGFTANHIVRIVATTVARLSQAKPDASVIPKSPDIEDQEGARVGQFFLDHWGDIFNQRRLRRELATWLATCGTGFSCTDWDDRAGVETESFRNPLRPDDYLDGNTLEDGDRGFLRDLGASEKSRKGSMTKSILAPFQVIVPSHFTSLEEAPWAAIVQERSLGWVWDHYPEEAKYVVPNEGSDSLNAQYYKRLQSLVNRSGYTQSRNFDDNESVTVVTLWIPPSGMYPNGAKIVATHNVLLENSPHPFAEAGLDTRIHTEFRYPITRFRYLPVPGRFWGTGLVEHLIDPQRDYNRAREQMQAIRDIMATPQWLMPETAQMRSVRNDYGDFWVYRSRFGGKPELQQPPSVSGYHVETEQQAVFDMQTISAQSDASQAQVPEGVRSGVALRALQEQDMMVMGPTIEEMEDGWQEDAKRTLGLTWKFLDEETSIVIYGDSRLADVHIFKGEDLNGNMQVRVRPGSMTPKSQAATQQMMIDMTMAGMLNPGDPDQHQKMMKTMEVGGMDDLYFTRDQDRRRASIENYMFWKPDPKGKAAFPDVDDDDDHETHLQEHLKFKKTDAFELLPPARKFAFEAHMMKHRRAQAAVIQAQMALMQMSTGGGSPPKPPGEASQPAEKKPTPGTENSDQ